MPSYIYLYHTIEVNHVVMSNKKYDYKRLTMYILKEEDYVQFKSIVARFENTNEFAKYINDTFMKYPDIFKQKPTFI